MRNFNQGVNPCFHLLSQVFVSVIFLILAVVIDLMVMSVIEGQYYSLPWCHGQTMNKHLFINMLYFVIYMEEGR